MSGRSQVSHLTPLFSLLSSLLVFLFSGHSGADQLCGLLEAIFLHELKDRKGLLWRERQNPHSRDLPEPVREREGAEYKMGRKSYSMYELMCSFPSHSGPVLNHSSQMR